MKVIKEGGLTELIKIVKTSLNGKEPNISKKSGFNLVKTDSVENDTNKLFTAKGAFDLKTAITNAYTSLVNSTKSTLDSSIATRTPHGGYSGSAQQLKNEIDNKLPNPGYGGVHELGRYLDLHLSGSTADFDARLSVNTDKTFLLQNANGNIEIGPKNTSYCHIYTDRPSFYFNKELRVNGNQVYHTGYKPSKSDVGLSAVNNWGASSSIGANSTAEYATTNMVAQVRNEKLSLGGGQMSGILRGRAPVVKTALSQCNQDSPSIDCGYISVPNSGTQYAPMIHGRSHLSGAGYVQHVSMGHKRTLNSWGNFYIGVGGNDSYPTQEWLFHGGNGILTAPNEIHIRSGNGYLEMGPKNTSHCHIYTDRGTFYFNKHIQINGANVLTDGGAFGTVKFSNWVRTTGNCGWYNETYGGGIMMQDSTWVRTHGGKQFYVSSSSADAIHTAGGVNAVGRIIGSQVFNAVWNDYAEFFPKRKGYATEAGDIIALCEDDDGEYYELATSSHCMIVGAHSDCFGHLIGGEKPPLGEDFVEWNKDSYIPVGLVGRLPVKFIGVAKKGMKVVPSEIPGVGREFKSGDSYDNVIGYIVENNSEEGIRRVKIKIGK